MSLGGIALEPSEGQFRDDLECRGPWKSLPSLCSGREYLRVSAKGRDFIDLSHRQSLCKNSVKKNFVFQRHTRRWENFEGLHTCHVNTPFRVIPLRLTVKKRLRLVKNKTSTAGTSYTFSGTKFVWLASIPTKPSSVMCECKTFQFTCAA